MDTGRRNLHEKRIALVLTLMFTLTVFAACAETSEETEAPEAADAPSKTLVVYFSATGSTERIAHMIAAETEADVFVITPEEPYTDADLNWTDSNSRVVFEHENPEAQNEVALTEITPENWETAGTITTPCLSATPSGGALPHGRSISLSPATISPAKP